MPKTKLFHINKTFLIRIKENKDLSILQLSNSSKLKQTEEKQLKWHLSCKILK